MDSWNAKTKKYEMRTSRIRTMRIVPQSQKITG